MFNQETAWMQIWDMLERLHALNGHSSFHKELHLHLKKQSGSVLEFYLTFISDYIFCVKSTNQSRNGIFKPFFIQQLCWTGVLTFELSAGLKANIDFSLMCLFWKMADPHQLHAWFTFCNRITRLQVTFHHAFINLSCEHMGWLNVHTSWNAIVLSVNYVHYPILSYVNEVK